MTPIATSSPLTRYTASFSFPVARCKRTLVVGAVLLGQMIRD